MFKIYDANIIYFHFCIAPTTTAALNRPGSSLWKKPTFFYGTLQFTHEHLVVKICCSKEMLFLFVLSRKNFGFFVSNANCQGEFSEYFFNSILISLVCWNKSNIIHRKISITYVAMCKVFAFKRISNFSWQTVLIGLIVPILDLVLKLRHQKLKNKLIYANNKWYNDDPSWHTRNM